MFPTILAATLLPSISFIPPLATMSLWYALPLVISVSLVCAATRQEEMAAILNHALRFGVWILVFMGVVMAALEMLERLA